MLKVQSFNNLLGFGNGERFGYGEYEHSEGMRRSLHGLSPQWRANQAINDSTLSGLTLINCFAQAQTNASVGHAYVYGVADDGKIYRSLDGVGAWSLFHTPATTTFGNGLIGTPTGELFYLQTRYLGRIDTSGATNDTYQDFGASSLPSNGSLRDADSFEDLIVMTNGSSLATFNVQTATFAANAFTLPSKDFARAVRANSKGLLIGVNRGNRGAFFLWDGNSDRSISPWIWKNGNIQAIVTYKDHWIVITNREIIETDGYQALTLVSIPDYDINNSYISVLPQGAQVINDYLIMANTTPYASRLRGGFWILNLNTKLWEYAPVSNGGTMNNTMGAVFFDSNYRTHVSYKTAIPNRKYIGYLSNDAPSRAYVITGELGAGNRKKTAEGVKLSLGISPQLRFSYPITFNVAVKLYKFGRPLWTYAQQKVTAGANNQITVDGTASGYNKAQVGDEVTIMEGTNAGQTAHITSISGQGTSTEVWTLDTSLTGLTEQNVYITVQPFKLLKKHTLTSLTELKDLYFSCKNQLQGQKFLLKILFDNISNIPPELLSGDFIYNEKDTFTSN
jgi:hypothetical protein